VVSRAAEIWLRSSFGIWHGRGTGHGLAMRHRTHPGSDTFPEDDQEGVSLAQTALPKLE
jgi:hypothetical protein